MFFWFLLLLSELRKVNAENTSQFRIFETIRSDQNIKVYRYLYIYIVYIGVYIYRADS